MTFEVSYSRSKKTVSIDDIDMVEAELKYLNLYSEGRVYIYSGTVKKIMEDYPELFIEVSRGKLIKLDKVSHIEKDIQRNHYIVPKVYREAYPKFKMSRRTFKKSMETLLTYREKHDQPTDLDKLVVKAKP